MVLLYTPPCELILALNSPSYPPWTSWFLLYPSSLWIGSCYILPSYVLDLATSYKLFIVLDSYLMYLVLSLHTPPLPTPPTLLHGLVLALNPSSIPVPGFHSPALSLHKEFHAYLLTICYTGSISWFLFHKTVQAVSYFLLYAQKPADSFLFTLATPCM